MYFLAIDLNLAGAHQLRNYPGACSLLHGHNWKLKVEVRSERLNELGMVIDFKDLSDICWQAVGAFDHRFFNEIPPFDVLNPTAENLARFFYQEIGRLLPAGVAMHDLYLWETEKYQVRFRE
jgi:6-pyruvoyltetrahydropterin/6-carboxytetrahydropterin synthase